MNAANRWTLIFSAGLVVLVGLAGCKGEARVPVFPVTGQVNTFDGEIPAGANVTLHAQSPVPGDVAPVGKVQPDGSFQIGTYDVADGAPAGEYVVTVEWFKPVEQGRGPNVLPKKYSTPASSPVRVSVSAATNIPPITITR
jgi:hypothetical protein